MYENITVGGCSAVEKTINLIFHIPHIVRSNNDLNRIREYIKNNPSQLAIKKPGMLFRV